MATALDIRSAGRGAVCVICLLSVDEEEFLRCVMLEAGGESVDCVGVLLDADEEESVLVIEIEPELERKGTGDGRDSLLCALRCGVVAGVGVRGLTISKPT